MLAVKEAVDEATESLSDQVAQCSRLARVLTMTRDMLEHAGAGQWDEVGKLESERKTDLELCFSQPVLIDQSPVVAEAIAAVLHLNQELMALVAEARDQFSKEGLTLNKNKTAVNSYLDNK